MNYNIIVEYNNQYWRRAERKNLDDASTMFKIFVYDEIIPMIQHHNFDNNKIIIKYKNKIPYLFEYGDLKIYIIELLNS